MGLLDSVHQAVAIAAAEGHPAVLIGGLAVAARADPRFTRDADLVMAVDTDAEAEAENDLLTASSGIEAEIVADDQEWHRAAHAVEFIEARGFHCGRGLRADLAVLRTTGEPSPVC